MVTTPGVPPTPRPGRFVLRAAVWSLPAGLFIGLLLIVAKDLRWIASCYDILPDWWWEGEPELGGITLNVPPTIRFYGTLFLTPFIASLFIRWLWHRIRCRFMATTADTPPVRLFGHFVLRAAMWSLPAGLLIFVVLAATSAGWMTKTFAPRPDRSWTGELVDKITGWPSLIETYGILVLGIFMGSLFIGLVWPWLRRQFTRQRRKLYLKFAGAFAVLVILLYGEEDWRGWHAWNQYRQQQEAQGESLDFDHFIPPPVPDDQNFFLAPIMVSACRWGMPHTNSEDSPDGKPVNPLEMKIERNGALFPGQQNTLIPWVGSGMNPGSLSSKLRPTNPVVPAEGITNIQNYQPPILGQWRLGEMTDLKAWQFYYRLPQDTNGRYGIPGTNEFPVAAQAQSPAADVRFALSKYDAALEALRQARQRPYARPPLDYGRETTSRISLPHLSVIRASTSVLGLRSAAELADGQTDKAFADVQLMLALADSMRDEPILLSQEHRRDAVFAAIQPIWEGLARKQWTDAQLALLDRELATFDAVPSYCLGVRGNRAAKVKDIESFRMNHRSRVIKDLNEDTLWIPTLLFRLCPDGWFYLNELGAASGYAAQLPTANETAKHVLPLDLEFRGEMAVCQLWERGPFPARFMLSSYLEMTVDHLPLWAAAQASVDMARLGCALERWHRAEGTYPDTLTALAPRFIASIPTDIVNGQPLHYRRTAEGGYLLYSVGWNGKDDGGVPGTKTAYDGEKCEDISQGDWVWQLPVSLSR